MIDRIDAALDMTASVVAGLDRSSLATPSLCPGWNVRAELNHLVGGMRIFAALVSGAAVPGEHEDDWLGADPHRAFTEAVTLDRAAWHRPDALHRPVPLSFGTLPGPMAAQVHLTELLVHGADLAVVTGQEGRLDQSQCEALLATMRAFDFTLFRRPGMFGPELPAAPAAPAHHRLLAFLGRGLPA